MNKKELIKNIIKLQTEKTNCFVKVATIEELQGLTKNDLIMVYNASYLVKGC